MIYLYKEDINELGFLLDSIYYSRLTAMHHKYELFGNFLSGIKVISQKTRELQDKNKDIYRLLIGNENVSESSFVSLVHKRVISLLLKLGIVKIEQGYVVNNDYMLVPYLGKYFLFIKDDYTFLLISNIFQTANSLAGLKGRVCVYGDIIGAIPILNCYDNCTIVLKSKKYSDILSFNLALNNISAQHSMEIDEGSDIKIVCDDNVIEDMSYITNTYDVYIKESDMVIFSGLCFNKDSVQASKEYKTYKEFFFQEQKLYAIAPYILRCLGEEIKALEKKLLEIATRKESLYSYFCFREPSKAVLHHER